jgi:hypothetical protein
VTESEKSEKKRRRGIEAKGDQQTGRVCVCVCELVRVCEKPVVLRREGSEAALVLGLHQLLQDQLHAHPAKRKEVEKSHVRNAG